MEKIIYYVDGGEVSREEFKEAYQRRVRAYGDALVDCSVAFDGDEMIVWLEK